MVDISFSQIEGGGGGGSDDNKWKSLGKQKKFAF